MRLFLLTLACCLILAATGACQEVMERTELRVFKGDSCYGVRLARIDILLEEAQRQGLAKRSDLALYVSAMLQTVGLAKDARWQDAVRCAAAGERSLDAYFG